MDWLRCSRFTLKSLWYCGGRSCFPETLLKTRDWLDDESAASSVISWDGESPGSGWWSGHSSRGATHSALRRPVGGWGRPPGPNWTELASVESTSRIERPNTYRFGVAPKRTTSGAVGDP